MKREENYKPWEIEPKWQKIWEKNKLFWDVEEKTPRTKKFYALVEFPYPSGSGLHIGHAFTMTIMDVFARKKRMEGKNVLHPMGWDAFGLPTENYAIRTGVHPKIVTKRNTDNFRRQMKKLAFSYNWSREVNTTDPGYYRWTQWIFLQFFKHGLAYKAEMPVGWCPSCKIVLANEEIVNGKCERCGTEAERKMQSQWLLRITAYADRLIDDLKLVDYPSYVKEAQINWIGKTQGIIIDYPVVDEEGNSHPQNLVVSCYTTRPDTNFGATFIVIAPEHPLVEKLKDKNQSEIENYIKIAKRKSELERTALEKEKTGVFTGWYALNRLTGKKLPIWISDFVVLTAGTGAVVGVPAHDERDFAFAKKYGLEIIPVIKPAKGSWDFEKAAFTDIDGGVVFNSDFLNGLPAKKAIEKIIQYLEKKGWGRKAVNYHLRDWIFSRQHYWGEPIPMVYCESCAKKGIVWWETEEGKKLLKNKNVQKILISTLGLTTVNGKITSASWKLFKESKLFREKFSHLAGWFPLPENQLPLELPDIEKYQPTETGESPLASIENWVNTACPHCGGPARRETDTMPNWAGSSWYYWRYCDPKNNKQPADPQKLKYWLPVDIYLGGGEHTTLHLLYSRFWHKFLYDIGVVPYPEPYKARRQHGVILGEDGEKMSKSRGNVVNPEDVVKKFGADALRTYLCFMGPYDATMPWNTKGLEGSWRFLNRVWRLFYQRVGQKTTPSLLRPLHKTIQKVTKDINKLHYNTALAAMMEFINEWVKNGQLSKEDAGKFLRLLAPFAPHITEELWVEILGNKFSIHQQPWPEYKPEFTKEEEVVIVVQVNGKVRGQIKVESKDVKNQSEIEKLAKAQPRVAKYLAGQKIRKTIFVPGKLINFVMK